MPLPFTTPEPVEHEIDGQSHKFWPISVGTLFKLRGLAKPLAKALAALLSNSQNDIGSEVVKSGEHQKVSTQPITSDLAKLRFEQRQGAIEQLMEGVFNDGSAKVLAELVIDSMREDFPDRKTDTQSFLRDIPAPVFMEMLAGVAKANKKLFDPLRQKAEEVGLVIRGSFGSPPPNEPPKESQQTEPTTSSGSTSNTPSSQA